MEQKSQTRSSKFWNGLLALIGLVGFGTGCASFEKHWDNAQAYPGHSKDLTGRWTGTWQNTNNDHGGNLRAVLVPITSVSDEVRYEARFHATWGRRKGGFKSVLIGEWQEELFVFESRRRILGVLITTAGSATSERFLSDYHSRFDTGTFVLERPPIEP